jgi:hypothetical protein
MQFEYTATFEDFEEAVTPKAQLKQPKWPFRAALTWSWLFIFCLACAVDLQDRLFPGVARPGDAPQPHNLWVSIAPALYLSSLGLTPMFRRWINRLFPSQSSEESKTRSKWITQILALVPNIWIAVALIPACAIEWFPRDNQMLWAGLTPLPLYFAIFAFDNARQKAKALKKRWTNRPSLQRPLHVEVTEESIFTDDGMVAHRYRWPHLKRYTETDRLLVLKTVDDTVLYFAKRAILEPTALDELKMLLSHKIAEGEFTTAPSAFPVITPATPLE